MHDHLCTTMESLAPELIQKIFSHLQSKSDLASFRLVQRSFAELGTEYFFKTVDVKPTYRGLYPLLEISQNAEFARHVKQVVLHLDDFRHSVWIPFTRKLKMENLEDGPTAQKADLLDELIREFEGFQISPDYTGILSSAFMRLPRLEAVQILERPSRKHGIDPQTIIDMDEHSLSQENLSIQREWGTNESYRAFSALVGAAYFSGMKLVSFRHNADILAASGPDDFGRDEPLIRRAAKVFQSCLILDLGLHQADTNLLSNLLLPAARVEKLGLKFDLGTYNGSASVFSKVVESGYVWPALKEVKIRTVCMHSHGSFLEFLQRHHATLRGLSLWDCKLSVGSWVDLILCMKDSLKLEWLELGLLSDVTKAYTELELEDISHYVLSSSSCELPLSLR